MPNILGMAASQSLSKQVLRGRHCGSYQDEKAVWPVKSSGSESGDVTEKGQSQFAMSETVEPGGSHKVRHGCFLCVPWDNDEPRL